MCLDVAQAPDITTDLTAQLSLDGEFFYRFAKRCFLLGREIIRTLTGINTERLQGRNRARATNTEDGGERYLETSFWYGDTGDTHILSLPLLVAEVAANDP